MTRCQFRLLVFARPCHAIEAQKKYEKVDAIVAEARTKIEVIEAKAKCLKEALDKIDAAKVKVEADLALERRSDGQHRLRSLKLRKKLKARSSRPDVWR